MSGIHVVIDSTIQAPPEMFSAHANFHSVSLTVMAGGCEYYEQDLSTMEALAMVEAGKLYPKTSQPSPGEFVKVLTPICQAGHYVIVITLAGGLSGTVQSAQNAAKLVNEQNICVIDSGTASIGALRLAEAALMMIANGQEKQQIITRLQTMAQATHTLFVPDTLTFLHKGGRIGGAATLFGNVMQIKPLLYIDSQGKVAILDKVRTKTRAVARAVAELQKYDSLAYIGVAHCQALQEAAATAEQIKQLYPSVPVSVCEVGPVLSLHLGSGMIGIIFQEKISYSHLPQG